MRYDELDLRLFRSGGLQVELRYFDPDPENRGRRAPLSGPVEIDRRLLLELEEEPDEYGRTLARQLFDHEPVLAEYRLARAAQEARGRSLRLQLIVDASADELQGLRWELLRDPVSGDRLTTSENVLFSRFLWSQDWRPVRPRRKAELRALIAVAAPSDLSAYRLAAVDREGEIARAEESLQGLAITVASRSGPVTLDRLVALLRQGVDILYLVCHGAKPQRKEAALSLEQDAAPFPEKEAVLFLENEAGRVERVASSALAERIRELAEPPLLAVLASCESGGTAGGDTQAALAPALAVAGVPAVVAMQGKISMATVEKAMPVFFAELRKDGQLDRALAVARGQVREQPDAWMPALYMRLKEGCLWYEPRFAGKPGTDFSKWKSLCLQMRQGRVIPIVGPDVGERVLGPTHELAGRLAEGSPLVAHERADLAKVLQYLSVDQDRSYAEATLLAQMWKQIAERFPDLARGEHGEPRSLRELLAKAGERCRQDPTDPHRLLAALPCPIYVTAGLDSLLRRALEESRKPLPLFCKWRPTEASHPAAPVYAGDPTEPAPIVYHVFGVFGEPDSFVLTEDDFYDYLIATAAGQLMPAVVRSALTQSSLLFLGFPLEGWTFRVLFRLIMTLEGVAKLKGLSHVGVQIEPGTYSRADAEQIRGYLEDYFNKDRSSSRGRGEPKIDLYWGTTADFLQELRRQLAATDRDQAPVDREEGGDGWY